MGEVRTRVSGQDGVSELVCFLVNNEAAKSDLWYKARTLPWFYFDAILVIVSIFTCNCQLQFGNPIPSGNPGPSLTHTHTALLTEDTVTGIS